MVNRAVKIIVCLLLALAVPLAACSSAGSGEIQIPDEDYPEDVFSIYPKSDLTEFESWIDEGNVKNYSVEARSKYKTGPIVEYYDALLQNADTVNKSTDDGGCTMQGSFRGYQFTINIVPDTANKRYKSILTVHLSQLESNIVINGTPYYMDPPPAWINGELWLPGPELFSLLNYRASDDQTRIECYVYQSGQPTIVFSFEEGVVSYGTEDAPFTADTPPFMSGQLYLSQEMINNVFGEILTCDGEGSVPVLETGGIDLNNAQQDNDNIFRKLELERVESLGLTRLSTMASACCKFDDWDWIGWVDDQRDDGFTEIRFSMNHIDAIPSGEDYTDYMAIEQDFPDKYKEVFAHARERGMTVRYILSFWDYQYRDQGGEISFDRMSTQEEIDRYLQYVQMTVSELAGLVDSYELWNEPDANYEGYQMIQPQDYINMARQAIPVIKEIDPEAEVVILSTCKLLSDEGIGYTREILDSDVAALADGLSFHSLNFDAMPQNRSEFYYNYENIMNDLLDLAASNGFTGYVVADELNYRSDYSFDIGQTEDTGFYYTTRPEIAAKNIARMMVINKGMGFYVGMSGTNSGVRFIEGNADRDYNRMLDGLSPVETEMTAESLSGRIRYNTFCDDAGDLYLAIWNDEAAAETSERTACDLTFKDIQITGAEWMDPYSMLQKDLYFQIISDGIVISGLNIPDYPVFIKLDLEAR